MKKFMRKTSKKVSQKSYDGNACPKANRTHPIGDRGGHKRIRFEIVAKKAIVTPVKSFSNDEQWLDVCISLEMAAPDQNIDNKPVGPYQIIVDEPIAPTQILENEAVVQIVCLSNTSSN